MPPKQKLTKETIVAAAVEIVRNRGVDALNARELAKELQRSTQPIFSNFRTMDEVKEAVLYCATEIYEGYLQKEGEAGIYPPYKASGMGYIRFAKEEKELFKLLFMRNRSAETIPQTSQELEEMAGVVATNLQIPHEDAFQFHLKMWIYVHGIATMMATSYLDWDWDFVSETLTDAYLGLRKRQEEKNDCHRD